MWKFAAIGLALAAPAAAQRQTSYTSPILYADYSDPDVIRVGRDYYLVTSSFHFSPGIPVLKSRDLVHWRIVGHVLPRLPFGPLYDMPGRPVEPRDDGHRQAGHRGSLPLLGRGRQRPAGPWQGWRRSADPPPHGDSQSPQKGRSEPGRWSPARSRCSPPM